MCVIIPFRLAFIEEYSYNWEVTYYIFDLFFLIDILLTFNTSYTSEKKKKEITDRKQIAKNYLTTWFAVDIISILPFDAIIQLIATLADSDGSGGKSNINMIVRVSRMGKIYKLVRLIRLVKIFKILKNKDNLQA